MTEHEEVKSVLDKEQQQRLEAVRQAASVLKARGFLSSSAVMDTGAVLTLAMFILHGPLEDAETASEADPVPRDDLAVESPSEANVTWYVGMRIDPAYRGEKGYPPRGTLLRVETPLDSQDVNLTWWEYDDNGIMYSRGKNQPYSRITDESGLCAPENATKSCYDSLEEVLDKQGALIVADIPCKEHNAGPWCVVCLVR